MTSIFIIVNEWTTLDLDTSSEVVGGTYFSSEDSAWDALRLIAEAYDEGIEPGDTSFYTENDPHLQYQEYYIQELSKGDML